MKKDANKTASDLLKLFGGKDNISSVSHCATRLRIDLKDDSVVDSKAVTAADNVVGYFFKGGQHQIILGTGFVNKVYDEFAQMCALSNVENKEELEKEKKPLDFQQVTKMISDIFIPIIPVLLATGILMGLRGLLINGFGLVIPENLDQIFSVLTDTAYTFIPVLVCWSAVKKFGDHQL